MGRTEKLHSEQIHGLSSSPNKNKYDQIIENEIRFEVLKNGGEQKRVQRFGQYI
jgi:hypothetical protein